MLLLIIIASAAFVLGHDGSQLLRLQLKNPSEIELIRKLEKDYGLDLWLEPSLKRPTDIYVDEKNLLKIKSCLLINGIKFEISLENVGRVIEEQRKRGELRQDDGGMNWEAYQRYDTIMEYMDSLAFRFPDVCSVTTYGTSTEGRPLRVMKLGRNTTITKPAFFIDGGMHAREWISPAIVTYFMNELTENQDSNQDILNNMDIYIAPLANPDGYEYSHNVNRLWRKTRSDHDSLLRCMGVDPNRNFEFEWAGDGTSGDKCSDIFHGPFPFSEPETKSMTDFIVRLLVEDGVNWVSYFAIHSYAQMWLVPWGYTFDLPENFDELLEFGMIGARAIGEVHGSVFQVGSVTQLLEPGAGGSDDWAYGTGIFRYSQTVEVRDTGRFGFLLPPDQIIPAAEETWAAIKATARFVLSK